jgi:predicted MPP superfamily phosphohydrolase
MATLASSKRAARSERPRGPFDPTPGRVFYSARWLSALAGATAVGALAASRGGLPAAAAFGVVGLAGLAYATVVEPRRPVLERITLRLPQLPAALDGLRIGQLSDLHLGHPFTTANTRWAVLQMAIERPDLLVITGDFVSYKHVIADLPALLEPLRARLGIFAVPGNHDYWEGLPEIRRTLEPLGIQFLLNTHQLVTVNDAQLAVIGVDDLWEGESDLAAALDGVPHDATKLLLSHVPDLADEAAAAGVAVQLSGHTHGGHVRAPVLGPLALPRHGTRYPLGLLPIGGMHLYVTRGVGGMPLRFGCPPEATILTLRRG